MREIRHKGAVDAIIDIADDYIRATDNRLQKIENNMYDITMMMATLLKVVNGLIDAMEGEDDDSVQS